MLHVCMIYCLYIYNIAVHGPQVNLIGRPGTAAARSSRSDPHCRATRRCPATRSELREKRRRREDGGVAVRRCGAKTDGFSGNESASRRGPSTSGHPRLMFLAYFGTQTSHHSFLSSPYPGHSSRSLCQVTLYRPFVL